MFYLYRGRVYVLDIARQDTEFPIPKNTMTMNIKGENDQIRDARARFKHSY